MEWIQLAQDWVRKWIIVITVLNLGVPRNSGILVGKHIGKHMLGRKRRRWCETFKTVVREARCEDGKKGKVVPVL